MIITTIITLLLLFNEFCLLIFIYLYINFFFPLFFKDSKTAAVYLVIVH